MSPHAYEPELDQPTPRRVAAREGCAYGCGLWAVRLFCLPHTLVGPFLLYQAGRAAVLYFGVLLAGTEVDGTVAHKTAREGKKGPYYTVDYVFAVDGAEYPGQTQTDAETYAGLREGQPIRVRVWEAAPAGGHSWDGSEAGSLGGLAGICFGAVGWNAFLGVFIWFLYVRPWRRRQLVRYGVPAAGRVHAVKVSQEKGGPAYRVYYTFTAGPSELFGGRRSGSVRVSPPKDASDVKAGDVLTVLYDPKRPRRSLLYRFAHHKAVPE
jgi:uncharacterized protein DUF3592